MNSWRSWRKPASKPPETATPILRTLMEQESILPEDSQSSEPERLAYSINEAAALLGVNYFSVYRLIQRGKLRACRALRGKILVPRSELLKLLKG
jgi:excisionase family DNA binding protein